MKLLSLWQLANGGCCFGPLYAAPDPHARSDWGLQWEKALKLSGTDLYECL